MNRAESSDDVHANGASSKNGSMKLTMDREVNRCTVFSHVTLIKILWGSRLCSSTAKRETGSIINAPIPPSCPTSSFILCPSGRIQPATQCMYFHLWWKRRLDSCNREKEPVSEAWVTPRSLTPMAKMTILLRKWLPYDRDDVLIQNWWAVIFRT